MNQPATPLRVPDHMSRADICAYLRELRLHFGLSESDVSERLHIRVKYVAAIEQGAFEAMPGKAYARGYVHTYAEFLGLDAEQVVERCFGPELAREVQAHKLPSSSQKKGKAGRWSLVAVAVVLGFLGFAAFHDTGGSDDYTREPQVEAVPESYLEGLRTMVMPSAESMDCFAERKRLGCFYAQRSTREWVMPKPAHAPMLPATVIEKMEREKEARVRAEQEAAAAEQRKIDDETRKAAQAVTAKKAEEARRQAAIDAAKKAETAKKEAPKPVVAPVAQPKKEAPATPPKSILPATQELNLRGIISDGDE